MQPDFALETRGVNKRFGGVVAASDVDLQVSAGELRCIIGPNGAGKSTLFALLCGIQRVDSGHILIHGHDVTRMHQFKRVRLGVGLTFQTNRAFQALSVRRNLTIPDPHLGSGDKARGRQRLAIALEGFGLDPDDPTPAGELPHHKLQWLEMSMVLGGFPETVLIDEPTAGMSREETNRTAEVLQRLNETGLTIVVVEHDIHFVKSVAQKVTVLHQGRVFIEGGLAEVTGNEDVKKIYLGHAH
jgi:branched-chain amino acid transport system ATP-binding protein